MQNPPTTSRSSYEPIFLLLTVLALVYPFRRQERMRAATPTRSASAIARSLTAGRNNQDNGTETQAGTTSRGLDAHCGAITIDTKGER